MSRGLDVLVATPGRLLDLIDQRALSLRELEILVLDEADQMLDLGFIHALKRIVSLVPAKRQTLFFSATMPKAIKELADKYLTNPAEVAVTPVATTADRVEQSVVMVNQPEKTALLTMFLKARAGRAGAGLQPHQAWRRQDRPHARGGRHRRQRDPRQQEPGRSASGRSPQFKSGEVKVLIATDIAARGIDIPGVSHVINYDLPEVPEQYVHRIGRTARAGAEGKAIAYLPPRRARTAARYRAADAPEDRRCAAPGQFRPGGSGAEAPQAGAGKAGTASQAAVALVQVGPPLRGPASRKSQRPASQDRSGSQRTASSATGNSVPIVRPSRSVIRIVPTATLRTAPTAASRSAASTAAAAPQGSAARANPKLLSGRELRLAAATQCDPDGSEAEEHHRPGRRLRNRSVAKCDVQRHDRCWSVKLSPASSP